MYDVGEITAEIQARFGLFCPTGTPPPTCARQTNKATPANLLILLRELEDVTETISDEVNPQDIVDPTARLQYMFSMAQWRARLAEYIGLVEDADPNDREAVLWDVTAPLLLGFYGGEGSTDPQRIPDATTPFILANQDEVSDAFRDELWDAFVSDLRAQIRDVVKAFGLGFAGVAAAALLLWAVTR